MMFISLQEREFVDFVSIDTIYSSLDIDDD